MASLFQALVAVGLTNWLTIAAIIIGPIAAIRIQKKIEAYKEQRSRQIYIFRVLMATRATRLAPDHVTALNMIDMDFSEKHKKEKPVVRAWRVLLDQFGKYPRSTDFVDQNDFNNALVRATEKSEDYFVDLLFEMSKTLGYDFEKIHIRNGCYAPTGHAEIENDNRLLRKGVLAMLGGQIHLNMNVRSMPEQAPHESLAEFFQTSATRQQEMLELFKKITEGDARISVALDNQDKEIG